jgi:hypothetical protein
MHDVLFYLFIKGGYIKNEWHVIVALVHGIHLGALWAEALFKVPLKVLIWGILVKVPLIHYNLGHFDQTASNSKKIGAF